MLVENELHSLTPCFLRISAVLQKKAKIFPQEFVFLKSKKGVRSTMGGGR